MSAAGFEVRSQIIWAKDRLRAQPRPLSLAARALLVCGAQGLGRHWTGDRKQTTLWQIPAREGPGFEHGTAEAGRVHEAADREQLLARPGGLRAVLRLRHHHHRRRDDRPDLPRDRALPQYVDVAVQRWQAFTGYEPRLSESGKSFDEVRAARLPETSNPQTAE